MLSESCISQYINRHQLINVSLTITHAQECVEHDSKPLFLNPMIPFRQSGTLSPNTCRGEQDGVMRNAPVAPLLKVKHPNPDSGKLRDVSLPPHYERPVPYYK